MGLFDRLAEARIQKAIERGDLDDLPGAGKPLALEDNTLVPEELRVAYRILRNAGYVPEEVRVRGSIAELERLISRLDGEEHAHALRRLELLRARLSAQRGGRVNLQIEDQYRQQVLERLQAGSYAG